LEDNKMKKYSILSALVGGLLVAGGCSNSELERLQEENARLRQEIANLQLGKSNIQLLKIDEFTVGLAAAEKNFDENAFLQHLRNSLQNATLGAAKFSIVPENDEQQVAKVRGMLVQQYISEEKIPIRISNLSYKLKDPKADFKLGQTMVPREGLSIEKTSDGSYRFTYDGTLLAQMNRESAEQFSISYEDSGGGTGIVPLSLKEGEIFDPSRPPQTARQGDIAFNWQLSLEKIHVYRISNFVGDVGSFLRNMRYPTTGLNQYQTIRDTVFLFGYGPYFTGLVNRLETPRFIDQVEVLQITADVFQKLKVGISEEELSGNLQGLSDRWIGCKFVQFTGDKKIWERPMAVGFPFLSRQTSQEKQKTFYTKYDQNGPVLIGDFGVRGR